MSPAERLMDKVGFWNIYRVAGKFFTFQIQRHHVNQLYTTDFSDWTCTIRVIRVYEIKRGHWGNTLLLSLCLRISVSFQQVDNPLLEVALYQYFAIFGTASYTQSAFEPLAQFFQVGL